MRRQTLFMAIIFAVAFSSNGFAVERSANDATEELTPLQVAVDKYAMELRTRGKDSFASLISDERVRQSIRTSLASYEALLLKEGEPVAGARKDFEDQSRPLLMEIANENRWPEGTEFFDFFESADTNGVRCDGYFLRLKVLTPDGKYKAFAIPIIDLYFGRFAD